MEVINSNQQTVNMGHYSVIMKGFYSQPKGSGIESQMSTVAYLWMTLTRIAIIPSSSSMFQKSFWIKAEIQNGNITRKYNRKR